MKARWFSTFAVAVWLWWPVLAQSQPITLGVAGGLTHLDMNTPFHEVANRATLKIEGGKNLTSNSAAKLRLDLMEFEGLETQVALSAEWFGSAHLGLFAMAGIAGAQLSRVGPIVGFGSVARWPVAEAVDARFELLYMMAERSDFVGTRLAATLGVSYLWSR